MVLSLALALLNHGTAGVGGSLLANPPASSPAPATQAPAPPPAAPKRSQRPNN